jgi:L-threonylcarbamoyladenylate synthase
MTIIIKAEAGINKALDIIRAEDIIAIPTETVYGLAGLASSEKAIKKIYDVKNRPVINPLISHYARIEELEKDVELNDTAHLLLEEFSPGPLTLVLLRKRNSRISDLACAGLPNAAVRIPKHPVAFELLDRLGEPVVAPSANPSGRLSPVSANNVLKMFNDKLDYVLDGGTCDVGLESTVVAVQDSCVKILRYGAVTVEDLLRIVSEVKVPERDDPIQAPGMLLKHYAPKCGIRIGTEALSPNEALLAYGDLSKLKHGFARVLNLSERANLEEAAANLFKMIHQLEEEGVAGIVVMPIPDVGIGQAINDRLERAVNSSDD